MKINTIFALKIEIKQFEWNRKFNEIVTIKYAMDTFHFREIQYLKLPTAFSDVTYHTYHKITCSPQNCCSLTFLKEQQS